MSANISDMILFVNKLSELNLPDSYMTESVPFENLSDDVPETLGKVFDGDVKVEKVRGV